MKALNFLVVNVFGAIAGLLLWFVSFFVEIPKYVPEPHEGEVELWKADIAHAKVYLSEDDAKGGIGWSGEV